MKRSLDFIPMCDGKSLEGFKQRSDITLCMLKKITEAAALIKKGIRRHLGEPHCNNSAERQARRSSWARRCWWKL